MDWKLGTLVAALMVAPCASAQTAAPFCRVDNNGRSECFHWSLQSCRQAVSSLGGMCAPNQAATQAPVQPVMPQSRIYDRMMQGLEMANQPRNQQPPAQVYKSTSEPLTNDGYWVTYKCPDGNGGMRASSVPEKGCVVDYAVKY